MAIFSLVAGSFLLLIIACFFVYSHQSSVPVHFLHGANRAQVLGTVHILYMDKFCAYNETTALDFVLEDILSY